MDLPIPHDVGDKSTSERLGPEPKILAHLLGDERPLLPPVHPAPPASEVVEPMNPRPRVDVERGRALEKPRDGGDIPRRHPAGRQGSEHGRVRLNTHRLLEPHLEPSVRSDDLVPAERPLTLRRKLELRVRNEQAAPLGELEVLDHQVERLLRRVHRADGVIHPREAL